MLLIQLQNQISLVDNKLRSNFKKHLILNVKEIINEQYGPVLAFIKNVKYIEDNRPITMKPYKQDCYRCVSEMQLQYVERCPAHNTATVLVKGPMVQARYTK